MKRFYFGTNFKMHKTAAETAHFVQAFSQTVREYAQYRYFIIPSYTSLWQARRSIDERGVPILLGAQNMHDRDSGAYTGEISPGQLKEIGIDLIELGHSERRQYYNETDPSVNAKVLSAISHGFTPLICIGEHISEKCYGISEDVIRQQIKIALHGVVQPDNVMIAYEPVWAIGESGIEADPPYIEHIHSVIHSALIELFGESGNAVPLLYGGSVNLGNAAKYARLSHVDGLFIGRSAWDPYQFHRIVETTHSALGST